MIIVMNPRAQSEEIENIRCRIQEAGCEVHESRGINYLIFGLIGETSKVDPDRFLHFFGDIDDLFFTFNRTWSGYYRKAVAPDCSSIDINFRIGRVE